MPSEVKYAEQIGQGYAGYHEVVPFMSKELDVQLKGQESGDILTIPWYTLVTSDT